MSSGMLRLRAMLSFSENAGIGIAIPTPGSVSIKYSPIASLSGCVTIKEVLDVCPHIPELVAYRRYSWWTPELSPVVGMARSWWILSVAGKVSGMPFPGPGSVSTKYSACVIATVWQKDMLV